MGSPTVVTFMNMYLQQNHLAGSPTVVTMEIQNYGDPSGADDGAEDCACAHNLIACNATHATSRRMLAVSAAMSKAILLS